MRWRRAGWRDWYRPCKCNFWELQRCRSLSAARHLGSVPVGDSNRRHQRSTSDVIVRLYGCAVVWLQYHFVSLGVQTGHQVRNREGSSSLVDSQVGFWSQKVYAWLHLTFSFTSNLNHASNNLTKLSKHNVGAEFLGSKFGQNKIRIIIEKVEIRASRGGGW